MLLLLLMVFYRNIFLTLLVHYAHCVQDVTQRNHSCQNSSNQTLTLESKKFFMLFNVTMIL